MEQITKAWLDRALDDLDSIEDARLFYDFAREVYEQIKVELEAIS